MVTKLYDTFFSVFISKKEMFSAIIKQFINHSYTQISHIRDTFISIHKP